MPAPTGACAGFPLKPWLCAAGDETARPGSLTAVVGIIPGSLTLSPVVGLKPSMRLGVSSPPWRKVAVLTTPPPQLLPQAMAPSFRCGRGIQPTQPGPLNHVTWLGDHVLRLPGNHTQPVPGMNSHQP